MTKYMRCKILKLRIFEAATKAQGITCERIAHPPDETGIFYNIPLDSVNELCDEGMIKRHPHLSGVGTIEYVIIDPVEYASARDEAIKGAWVSEKDIKTTDGTTYSAPYHEWITAASSQGCVKVERSTPQPKPKDDTPPAGIASIFNGFDESGDAQTTQTDRLIDLGKIEAEYFHTPEDKCFVSIKLDNGGYGIMSAEPGGTFSKVLIKRFVDLTGKAPAQEPLNRAITTLQSGVWGNGDIRTLHTRIAPENNNVIYDLTNATYDAIRISGEGWALMEAGHTLFKRHSHQQPQAVPISGGDPEGIFDFVNVAEADRLLMLVYLISCFVPDIAHPVPIITGEHGSAKTTASDMFKSLVDPSILTGGVSMPAQDTTFYMTVSHHWFLIFDNIDTLKQWQSDALCRATTGQATSVRTLYTNEAETIFKYKICVGLNGINNAAYKPDLLSRAIYINLEHLGDDTRVGEIDLWTRYNAAKPGILGGIFDVLSKAIAIYPSVRVPNLPRMADFTLWGCAISEALGHTHGEFLTAYNANISRVNLAALDASPVAQAIISFMESRQDWKGTPEQLLRELDMYVDVLMIDTRKTGWAQTPRSLGRKMKDIIPNLRKVGIEIEKTKGEKRLYHIFYSAGFGNAGDAQTTEIMRQIQTQVTAYGREDTHVLNVISAKLEKSGHDIDLIDVCIQRYREGHRVHVASVFQGGKP